MTGSADYVRALAWPVVASAALIGFFGPLRQVVEQLPDLLSHSESIEIGGVKIRARVGTLTSPPADIRETVASLSPLDIRFILDNKLDPGDSSFYVEASEEEKAQWQRLVALKLVTEMSTARLAEESAKPGHERYDFGVSPSSLLSRVREYLVVLTFDLVQDITKSPPEVPVQKNVHSTPGTGPRAKTPH